MRKAAVVFCFLFFLTGYSFGLAQQEADGMIESRDGDSVLTMGIIAPPDHPVELGSRFFADKVAELAEGRLTIDIVPSGRLGNELELQKAAREERVDLINIGCSISAVFERKFHIFHFPFVWESREQLRSFLISEEAEAWNEAYRRKSGLRILADNWEQPVHLLLSKNRLTKPEDVAGVRIRVPYIETYSAAWEAVGAASVPLAFSEIRSALREDRIEAMGAPLIWMERLQLYDEAKYVIRTEHLRPVNHLQINEKAFNRLSEKQRQILLNAAKEAGVYATAVNREVALEAEELLKSKGIVFSDFDNSSFRKKIESIAPRYESLWGEETWETVQRFRPKD